MLTIQQSKGGALYTGFVMRKTIREVVGHDGFEPSTNGLKVRCSTS